MKYCNTFCAMDGKAKGIRGILPLRGYYMNTFFNMEINDLLSNHFRLEDKHTPNYLAGEGYAGFPMQGSHVDIILPAKLLHNPAFVKKLGHPPYANTGLGYILHFYKAAICSG